LVTGSDISMYGIKINVKQQLLFPSFKININETLIFTLLNFGLNPSLPLSQQEIKKFGAITNG
jgi:hypothetical protein